MAVFDFGQREGLDPQILPKSVDEVFYERQTTNYLKSRWVHVFNKVGEYNVALNQLSLPSPSFVKAVTSSLDVYCYTLSGRDYFKISF